MTEQATTASDAPEYAAAAADDTAETAAGPLLTVTTENEDLIEALRDVVDPELGINVVDLGLVYGVNVDADRSATIDMTLTSAACPLTDVIEDQAREALDGLVSDFRINWVWMPPWGPENITVDGRDVLLDRIEPRLHPVEPLVDRLEPAVHGVEPAAHRVEPPLDCGLERCHLGPQSRPCRQYLPAHLVHLHDHRGLERGDVRVDRAVQRGDVHPQARDLLPVGPRL